MKDFDDEISFKPLSEGLGFHQKQIKLEAGSLDFFSPEPIPVITPNTSVKKSEPLFMNTLKNMSQSSTQSSVQPIIQSKAQSTILSTSQHKIQSSIQHQVQNSTSKKESVSNDLTPVWSQPATKTQNSWGGNVDLGLTPREDGIVDRDSLSRPVLIDNPFYVPRSSVSPVEVVTLKFSGHDGLRKVKTKPVTTSFLAITMDVLTLISLCMILLTFYFASLGQSLSEVILEIPHNAALKNQFFGLTISIGFLYLIISRCVFGRTIGEWMFHMQLGSIKDQEKSTYPVRVFIRTLIVFVTGLIFFPIISFAFKKDFLASFCGLELHA